MEIKNFKKIFSVVIILTVTFSLSSCLMDDDLMTADVKTGGLIDASTLVQYLPTSDQGISLNMIVYPGPAVQVVKVYKTFYHKSTGKYSNQELLSTIDVNGSNASDTISLSPSYTWDQLIQGLSMEDYTIPSAPSSADVGDYFILTYKSVLSDGREVSSNLNTTVLVANTYAGYYISNIKYFHPTAGGHYPDEPYYKGQVLKELITINSETCSTKFAIWGSYGEEIILTINADNSIDFEVVGFTYIVKEGDPENLLLHSHYDPLTHFIYLYYYYEAPGGNRIFWEVLEPYNGG